MVFTKGTILHLYFALMANISHLCQIWVHNCIRKLCLLVIGIFITWHMNHNVCSKVEDRSKGIDWREVPRYGCLAFWVIQILNLWISGQKVSEEHRVSLHYLRPWVCSTPDCEFQFSNVESSQKLIIDWLKVSVLNFVINFHLSLCPYSHFKLHQAQLSW